MQGASRDTLAAAQERLETLLQRSGSDGTQIGDALFAVSGVLDSTPSVGRALTDPSRDGEAKATLVSNLFDGKVPGEVVDLLAGLARSRWSRARDLADTVAELAAMAVVDAAERNDRLEDVEDELFRFRRTVDGSGELYGAFSDRAAPGDLKAELVQSLLEGKVAPETLRLARQAVLAPRGMRLGAVLTAYGRIAARRREQAVAHVVVAAPMATEDRERLREALSTSYGRKVHLNIDVDPAVMGGVRVEIGDEVLDGTIARRLDEVRRRLAR